MNTKFIILLALSVSMVACITDIDKVIKETIASKGKAEKDLQDNRSDPFVSKLFSNGIKSFKSHSKVSYIQKIDANEFSGFTNYLASSLRIPSKDRKNFIDTLSASVWMDLNDWKEISFIFNLGKGQAKFVSIVVANDMSTNKIDVLISDVQSTFEIGDDIFVSTRTKKSFFGLFGSTKLVIKKVPAKMTRKSIELIFKFFKIVAFERFAAFRSIKF